MVNFAYERDIVSSFMVFNFSANEIEKYALKMLQYNKIPKLLEISEKSTNLECQLYYEITDKISLLEYTKSNAVEYPLLKRLIEGILELSETFQEYLLSEGCFMLNSETLFFDLETQNCYFLYLPILTQPFDFLGQLKLIVADLYKNIHRHDERAIGLIHKLRMVLDEENFGIVSIKKLLELEEKLHLQPAQTQTQTSFVADDDLEVKKEVKKGSKDGVITFMVLQIILGIVVIFYCVAWVVPEEKGLAILLKIIMLLSALCLFEFALISKLKGKPQKQALDQNLQNMLNDQRDLINATAEENLVEERWMENTQRQQSKWGWDNHKTERLNRAKQTGMKRAYWVDAKGIKTPIIKSPFLIGKFRGAVDVYIDGDGVSRLHCKIVQERDTYNLLQIDPHNNTYLNQQPLLHEARYPLKDGDVIHIGDETFIFQCF